MTHYIVKDALGKMEDKNFSDMEICAQATVAYLNQHDATKYEMYYGEPRFSIHEVQA
jgi:hypothetical protein